MGLIKKFKFAYDFFETRHIYPTYKNIVNRTNGRNFFNYDHPRTENLKNSVHIIGFINPYFDLILNEEDTQLKAIKIHRENGFLAQLDRFDSVEEYMNTKMGSKSRTKMRGYKRRLENCFDITYKMHFGFISKNEYDFLFSKFHEFLKTRFLQRGDEHDALEKWDAIKENTFDMIQNKTASLFVIYNENQPIDICLNYHHQNVMDNAIRSYDIDYSKFRLGYVDIYAQLDWCFKNGVDIFDLSLGDFDYKRLWCNVIYKFEHHILYHQKSITKRILAHTIVGYYRSKNYLKKSTVYSCYQKTKKLSSSKKKLRKKESTVGLHTKEVNKLDLPNDALEVDFLQDDYQFLRNYIYDFQYRFVEHSNDIKVYKLADDLSTHFIMGKNRVVSIEQPNK